MPNSEGEPQKINVARNNTGIQQDLGIIIVDLGERHRELIVKTISDRARRKGMPK